MITVENITSHEFIGLDTEITQSTNPQIIGLNGRIVDETRSMFKIDTKNGEKSVAKSHNSWRFTVNGKDVIVDGSRITKRPHDRIGGKMS